MSEFRHPHPFENIANAIQDALDPNKPDTLGSAINLVNENARAVEDAIDGGTTRGSLISDVEAGVASGVHTSFEWVIPGRTNTVFSGTLTLFGAPPAGTTLYLDINGTRYKTVSDGVGSEAVTAGITALTFTGDVTVNIEVWWESGAGTTGLSISGSGVYIAF